MSIAKKGETQVLWWVINLFFLALVFIAFFAALNTSRTGSAFERKFLAKDMALTLDSLYASPNDIILRYTDNKQGFKIIFEENKVKVLDAEGGDLAGNEYYFIEDEQVDFQYKEIAGSDGGTGTDIYLVRAGTQMYPITKEPAAEADEEI